MECNIDTEVKLLKYVTWRTTWQEGIMEGMQQVAKYIWLSRIAYHVLTDNTRQRV